MDTSGTHVTPLQDPTPQAPAFTIYVHVFYPEIWREMLTEIERRLQQPFNIVVTRPRGSPPATRPSTIHLKKFEEFEVDNRGRDILPFLVGFRKSEAQTEIGLKLHTKRSPHRDDGEEWRRFLIDSLLQCSQDGQAIGAKWLQAEPRIGLIAPGGHLLPLAGRLSINEGALAATLQRVAPDTTLSDLETMEFAAGSMFWFRRSALQATVDEETDDLFVREGGQLDGTAAHAFERLFAFLANRAGYLSADMESARALLAGSKQAITITDLKRRITETLEKTNKFSLPLADFWRRYPRLLKLAHLVYAKLPKGFTRRLRKFLGRS